MPASWSPDRNGDACAITVLRSPRILISDLRDTRIHRLPSAKDSEPLKPKAFLHDFTFRGKRISVSFNAAFEQQCFLPGASKFIGLRSSLLPHSTLENVAPAREARPASAGSAFVGT